MKRFEIAKQAASITIIFLLAASLAAPLRANNSASTLGGQNDAALETVTFDNLLPAGSYVIYAELRNVGQQVKAGGFAEMLEPLLPILGGVGREASVMTTFVLSHSDKLARSRLMFAMQPSKPTLPQALLAVELSSAEVAKEFEPEFKRFLISILLPGSIAAQGRMNKPSSDDPAADKASAAAAALPLFIKRAGRLLLVSDSSFTLESIRPEGSKLLSDDTHFRAARDRFSSETLFVYYNTRLSEQVFKERAEAYVEKTVKEQGDDNKPDEQPSPASEQAQVNKVAKEPGDERTAMPPPERATLTGTVQVDDPQDKAVPTRSQPQADKGKSKGSRKGKTSKRRDARVEDAEPATPTYTIQPELVVQPAAQPPISDGGAAQAAEHRAPGVADHFLAMVWGGVMSSETLKSPEAIAFAVVFEGDELIVRVMQVSDPAEGLSHVPLLSLLPSGPAMLPEAASYVPADTDVFLTLSVDLERMHESIFAMARSLNSAAAPPVVKNKKDSPKAIKSQIAAFEKKYGFKLKEELLAALGNEVAVAIPAKLFDSSINAAGALQSGVALLISIRNKDVLKAKLLPALEAFGLKAPKEKGVTEKRGDVEINSYTNASIALINNFLVIAFDRESIRRVVDGHAKNQTLAATKVFHDYVRWQPREVLAQVYVSSAIMKSWIDSAKKSATTASQEVKDFFARTNITPEPITYAASPDLNGAVYELHLPKNLIVMLLAQMSDETKRARITANEAMVRMILLEINETEKMYYSRHGKYGTFEEMESEGFNYGKDLFENFGYRFDLTVSGGRYELTATPIEYGKAGRLSYYTDSSGIIREGDHEGRPATAADKPTSAGVEKKDQ